MLYGVSIGFLPPFAVQQLQCIYVELEVYYKFPCWICGVWSAEFLACTVSKQGVTWISMSSQALMKAAKCARMWKMWKVCSSKCMAFSVSVLSQALATLNFMYGKLIHARNWSNQVSWWLHVKQPSYSHYLPTNSTWTHYSKNMW